MLKFPVPTQPTESSPRRSPTSHGLRCPREYKSLPATSDPRYSPWPASNQFALQLASAAVGRAAVDAGVAAGSLARDEAARVAVAARAAVGDDAVARILARHNGTVGAGALWVWCVVLAVCRFGEGFVAREV